MFKDVRFKQTWTPTEDGEIFSPVYDRNMLTADRSLYVSIDGVVLYVNNPSIKMLKEVKSFGKNTLACKHEKGVRLASHCLLFEKLTKLCIIVDKSSSTWEYKGICREEYELLIPESQQEIRFSNY
jgi:hypothetical protein